MRANSEALQTDVEHVENPLTRLVPDYLNNEFTRISSYKELGLAGIKGFDNFEIRSSEVYFKASEKQKFISEVFGEGMNLGKLIEKNKDLGVKLAAGKKLLEEASKKVVNCKSMQQLAEVRRDFENKAKEITG